MLDAVGADACGRGITRAQVETTNFSDTLALRSRSYRGTDPRDKSMSLVKTTAKTKKKKKRGINEERNLQRPP